MAKRFTDTEIWKKPWFRKLPAVEKCAFRYLKDSCDNVGVWDADFEQAEFCIGSSVDWKSFVEKTNGNVRILESGKWWLVDFCDFQYGELKEDTANKAHQSYIRLLKKHGLWETYQGAYKGHVWGIDAHKDKDKEKDKSHRYGLYKHVLLTDEQYQSLCEEHGKKIADSYLQKVDDYCETHGKTYQRWKSAIQTYIRNDIQRGQLKIGKEEIDPEIKNIAEGMFNGQEE